MKVSVVIPAYDAAETVADTLTSLLAQTHRDWEAVVVDDGSGDATAAIVRGFVELDGRIRLLQQANTGESGARNAGIADTRYDWLLFLDADDWIAPKYLERMTGALAGDSALDAVHCGYARVAADGSLVVEKYLPPTGDMFATWAQRSAFPVHACIVRKSLVEEVGRFDTSLRGSADWDLWQRIARTGARFGAVREVLAYYRMRPQGTSLDAPQMLADGLRVLRQGHAPDPRVPHPHPDHAQGAPPEEVHAQSFYLLCWCAGLQLGAGHDARPLLEMLSEGPFPELYPDAVAQCLFEAVPLPTCGSPAAWEQLWPGLRPQIDEFLEALEARSMAPELARQTRASLIGKIAEHTPIWRAVLEERDLERHALSDALRQSEELAAAHQALIAELEQTRTALLGELAEWRRWHHERETVLEQLRGAAWVRIGIRWGLVRPPAETDSRNHDPDGARARQWHLRVVPRSLASLVFPPHDPEMVRIAIAKAGSRTPWDIQLNHPGHQLGAHRGYRVELRARADEPRTIAFGVAQAHPPWAGLGLYRTVRLTSDWQGFQAEFVSTSDDADARVHFDVGGNDIAVEVTAMSLRSLPETKTTAPHPLPPKTGGSELQDQRDEPGQSGPSTRSGHHD